nr:caspase-8A [Dugesia japonica]
MGSYDMSKSKYCLIIGNITFIDKDSLPGVIDDANRLEKVFEKLGFEVRFGEKKKYKKNEMTTNLTASEIDRKFQNLSKDENLLNDISILVCIILSHGDAGIIYGSDEKAVKLDEIFGYFEGNNCKELRRKPKVFLIDACRGAKRATITSRGSSTLPLRSTPQLPNKADFLEGYATVKGYIALMTDEGFGWYMQALCNELEGLTESKDLLSILTIVNNKVATEYVKWKKYEIWLKDPKNQDAVKKEIWKNDPKNEVGTMYKKWLDDTKIQSAINEELEGIVQMPIFKCTLRNAVHLQLKKEATTIGKNSITE